MMFRRSMTTRTAPVEFHPAVAGLCCFDHVSAPIRHSIFALTISRLSEKAVVCCNTRCSRLNSQFSVEVGRLWRMPSFITRAVFHTSLIFAAGFPLITIKSASFPDAMEPSCIFFHDTRGAEGGTFQYFRVRNTCLYVQLQFAM